MSKPMRWLSLSLAGALLLVGLVTVGAQAETVFTYGTSQETMLFDPGKHVDETQSINIFNTYDPLVRPVRIGAQLVLRPWLAESWSASPDARIWTFKLRRGVKFHDGTELTAEDVAFSMDRMTRIGLGYASLWRGLLGPGDTVAPDRYTVVFNLKKPFAIFIPTLVQFFVVNKDLCLANEQAGDLCQGYLVSRDAGSGPFQVENVEIGREIIFRRFDGYFMGPALIDKVVWKVIPERATQVAALKAGAVDMVDQWLSPEVYADLERTSGIVVQRDPQLQLYLHQMNNKKPPFDDVHCRRAVLLAFDYETAINDIFRGGAQAVGPVPVLAPGWNPALQPYKRDLEAARAELAQCKHSAQALRNMELTYLWVSGVTLEERLGLLMRDNLKDLGMKVKLEAMLWAQLQETTKSPEAARHFTAIFHTLKIPHPDSHTYLMFHPGTRGAGGNYINVNYFEKPAASELLDRARVTVDPTEQLQLYGKAQEIVNKDAASLFIANPEHRIAFRDRVKGYTFNGILGYDLFFWKLRIGG
ncbi:MAG: ABC transporter substrate-binding protein [Candidatus Methylomirabilales bacterium]